MTESKVLKKKQIFSVFVVSGFQTRWPNVFKCVCLCLLWSPSRYPSVLRAKRDNWMWTFYQQFKQQSLSAIWKHIYGSGGRILVSHIFFKDPIFETFFLFSTAQVSFIYIKISLTLSLVGYHNMWFVWEGLWGPSNIREIFISDQKLIYIISCIVYSRVICKNSDCNITIYKRFQDLKFVKLRFCITSMNKKLP